MRTTGKSTLLQLQIKLHKRVILSVALMAVLTTFCSVFQIPNPNMILVTGLVTCSALFGFGGGIVSAIIALVYSLYFFSIDHSFVEFTDLNLQKIYVVVFGIVVNMVLVCSLKHAELRAFREIKELTTMLHQENQQLQSLSFSDALTGVQNRMALRRDYDTFNGREVTVIMIDLDRFKIINDTLGHKEGDRILKETGAMLAKTFGRDQCYRYGGDEFIIIMAEIPESRCRELVAEMMTGRPEIKTRDGEVYAEYSVGYAHERIAGDRSLRDLFADADKNMYENKRSKKSRKE